MPDTDPSSASHPDHDPSHGASSCDDAIEELYLYLDGELTDEKRTVIKGHLDDCSPCFEAFDFEAELRIVLSTRCRDEVPEDLRRRIASQLPGAGEQGAGPAPSRIDP